MFVRPRALGLLALVAAQTGCQEPPDLVCDRVRVVWPYFEVDASDDVSDEPGIQIDLDLATGLLPGAQGVLSVAEVPADGADGAPPTVHPTPAVAGADGGLHFDAVTVPLGRIELQLTAYDDCGQVASARRLYVWDGEGLPACDLTLGFTPVPSAEHAPLDVVGPEADHEPETPGIQAELTVAAGRPDMQVAVFVRAVALADDDILTEDSGADRAVTVTATLPPGEVSIRAVCTWPTEDLRVSSHTEHFVVVP